jgi:hypothetical protein
MPRPTAAQALFPHLPHRSDDVAKRQGSATVAEAMWPSLGQQPKPPSNPYRESLLRGLRELNQKIDARLLRERGRR